MALATTYNTAGNREDLTDIIAEVSPRGTPVYSSIKKTKAQAALHEWQMDKLLPLNLAAVPEGNDVTSYNNMSKQRTRQGVHLQQLREDYMVSKKQYLVRTAGVANEFDRQKVVAIQNLIRDIESVICSTQDDTTENGTSGDTTRGYLSWVSSTAQTGSNPVNSLYLTPASSILSGTTSGSGTTVLSTVTEDAFKGLLESIYTQSGETSDHFRAVVAPRLKKQIATFTKASVVSSTTLDTRRQNIDGNEKRLVDGVDIYDADWGIVTIEPSLFIGRTAGTYSVLDEAALASPNYNPLVGGMVFRDDLLELAMLQDIMSEENPDLGGGRRGFVDVIFGMCVLNPLGVGKIVA